MDGWRCCWAVLDIGYERELRAGAPAAAHRGVCEEGNRPSSFLSPLSFYFYLKEDTGEGKKRKE